MVVRFVRAVYCLLYTGGIFFLSYFQTKLTRIASSEKRGHADQGYVTCAAPDLEV